MRASTLAKLGWAGVAAGVLGLGSAIALIAWPPAVPEGVVSHPFTAAGFQVVQTWFALHHLLLIAVVVGLASSASAAPSRLARIGAWLAAAGLVGLTAMELIAIRFATWDAKAASEGAMGSGYGAVTTLAAVGMLLAGAGVIRAGVWLRPWRYLPLLIGASQFVVVMPAVFSGVFVAARLAIGFWMALFGALGWALVLEARGGAAGAANPRLAAGG